MSKKIQVSRPQRPELPTDGPELDTGQWYWVSPESGSKKDRWFGCVIHVGSNYVRLDSPKVGGSYNSERIHFDEFWTRCKHEPDPDGIIRRGIAENQEKVNLLMGRVKEVTARLAVAPSPELDAGGETQALATASADNRDFKTYKKDLVRAKEKTLPELFKEVEAANEQLASWMTAQLLPMKADVKKMRRSMNLVEERIFSVEIYAGLVEEVVRIRDGDPAALGEKIRLMQRRHYMDEECLAAYKTGGMNFNGLKSFDSWLARTENFERIFPFPRCVVAFMVRRNQEDFEGEFDIGRFINFMNMQKLNKSTFLYIRNGGLLYRLETALDFDAKLFPDMEKSDLEGKVYAYGFSGERVERLATEGEYLETVKEADEFDAEEKRKEEAGEDDKRFGSAFNWKRRESEKFTPFSKESVLYDDIRKMISEQMKRHNRIALIVQGLLDRSVVFHPHPPWQIWTDAGFRSALVPVYDESRALPAGEKPDFGAYRARLNESIAVGTVTLGQDGYWERVEAEKENDRLDNDRRTRSSYRSKTYRPYGNPGPGLFARVAKLSPISKKCTFEWLRDRASRSEKEGKIYVSLAVPIAALFNVDAYRPGDFKKFFDDPRTRAEYLRWAPLMLEAEEYHAGNRKKDLTDLLKEKPPPPAPSRDGKRRYRIRKEKKFLMGKAVRLTRDVTLRSEKVHAKGSLWRVHYGEGIKFNIRGILEDGTPEPPDGEGYVRAIHGLESYYFEVDLSVPGEKKDLDDE